MPWRSEQGQTRLAFYLSYTLQELLLRRGQAQLGIAPNIEAFQPAQLGDFLRQAGELVAYKPESVQMLQLSDFRW